MPIFRYYPNHSTGDPELEKKVFRYSLLFPSLIVFIIWLVKLTETTFGLDLSTYGIFPLRLSGLVGILASPLIHGSYEHLFANSVPLFILTFALTYFYRGLAYRIFFLIYFISGICVWLGGRESYHIGASGVVYGLASFLFFSGVLRSDLKLLTISIIVVFLYGSMFWGIFPFKPDISWESHLWGAISGLVLAAWFRHQGPRRPPVPWEDEPDDLPEENQEDFSGDIQSEENVKSEKI
jgi:membrane associated rhomboid family serine protease